MFINSEEILMMKSGKKRFDFARDMIYTAQQDAAAVAREKLLGTDGMSNAVEEVDKSTGDNLANAENMVNAAEESIKEPAGDSTEGDVENDTGKKPTKKKKTQKRLKPLRAASLNVIALDLGVDLGRFTKVIKGKKKFTFQPNQLDRLCHEYMGCSIHELYFGEKPQTRLSKDLSYVYHVFEKHGRDLKRQALENLENVYVDAEKNNRLIDSESCHNIARERLWTYIYDRGISSWSMLPGQEPFLFRTHVKNFLEGTQTSLYSATILYMCVLLDLSVDYMFDRVYSDVGTVFLFDDEKKTPILDEDFLQFVALYDQLRIQDKQKAMVPIFQKEWVNW